jgi:hypothetical protein
LEIHNYDFVINIKIGVLQLFEERKIPITHGFNRGLRINLTPDPSPKGRGE